MPDGTVRGTFDLNTPATRKLRDLQAAGGAADREMKQLGKTMDTVGGRQAEVRLERYGKRLGDLRRTSTRTHDSMRVEWASTTRVVDRETARQRKSVGLLQHDVNQLGRTHATATVDVDGVARALGQVGVLEARLNQLSRMRATPRVAMGGGFASGAGGGGGGGGGGGRRGFGLPSFMTGFALKAAPVLLPGAVALGGAGGALAGSAGAAALGGGALGVAGAGGLAVGAAGLFGSGRGTVKQLKDVTTAQQAYNKAVAQYGANSTQAQTAGDKWHSMLSQQPAAIRRVSTELSALGQEWHKANAPGRESFAQILSTGISTGRKLVPTAAAASNRVTAATAREARGFGRFLAGPTGRQGIRTGAAIFDENLRSIRLTGQNVMTTFVNIERAARPFFREGTSFVQRWTSHWAHSTSDIEKTRGKIGEMVQSLKDWGKLGGASWRLLRDLLGRGKPAGDSMVVHLTNTFNRWDEWVKRHPQRVEAFFSRAVSSTEKLATGLGKIIGTLVKIGETLTPVLDGFSTLAGLVGSLGLGAPGAGALLLGGLRGGRRVWGGGPGGGPGGGGMPAAVAVGGAAGMGWRDRLAAYRSGYGRYSQYGRLRGVAGGLAESTPIGSGIARGIVGGAARRYLPIGGAFAALSALGFQGNIFQRGQAGASSFTLGAIPMPQTTPQAKDAGTQAAQKWLAAHPRASSRSIRGAMGSLLSTPITTGVTGAAGFLRGAPVIGGLMDLGGGRKRPGTQAGLEVQAAFGGSAAKSRLAEYKALNAAAKDLLRTEQQLRRGRQRERGGNALLDMAKSYDILRKKLGSGAAFKDFQRNMREELGSRKLGRAGSRALANSGAQWIEQMRKNGQLTADQARQANRNIERSFKRMGINVRVINGQVFDGSRKEWSKIENQLGSHAERARQRVHDAFTAIQRDAVNSLIAMGISAPSARRIVQMKDVQSSPASQRAGQFAGQNARDPLSPGPFGQQRPTKARGGRLGSGARVPGRGFTDSQVAPDGGRWAPGELVVNRHTEARADRLLGGPGRLARLVAEEGRPHWAGVRAGAAGARRAGFYRTGDGFRALGGVLSGTGAIRGAFAGATGASYGGVTPAVAGLIQRLDAMGFHHGSTTGGGHVSGSYHYRGQAVDYGDASNDMQRLWSVVYPMRAQFAELFGPSRTRPGPHLMHFGAGFSNAALQAGHEDHIHMALTGGKGALGGVGMGAALPGAQSIRLRRRRSGLRGTPGALADRAIAINTTGREMQVNKQLAAMGGGFGITGAGFAGGGNAAANMVLGHQMMLAAGWGESEWPALRTLWQGESGWNNNARNASSGAYGIPQALGHGNVFGSNPADQIRWGLNYIRGRYGSPSAALSAWQARSPHWYALGGRLAGGFGRSGAGMDWGGFHRTGGSFTTRQGRATAFVAGEGGRREDVLVRPHRQRRRSAAASHTRGRGGMGHVSLKVEFSGPVHAQSQAHVKALGEKVADIAGKKLLAVLNGGDTVSDEELT